MKVLGIDIESTGINEDDQVIEFAICPVDLKERVIRKDLSFETMVKCDSFEDLEPNLSRWVIDHNKEIIIKAHNEGLPISSLKEKLSQYLNSPEIKEFFGDQKPSLFGKSLNGIDLPFLTRDFGWSFMRDHFTHRHVDVTMTARDSIVKGSLPENCASSQKLINFFNMKEDVDHRALSDIVDTAILYWNIFDHEEKHLLKKNSNKTYLEFKKYVIKES